MPQAVSQSSSLPPLPPGYTLDSGGGVPPLPAGYKLDSLTEPSTVADAGFLDREIPITDYGAATMSGLQSIGRGVRGAIKGMGAILDPRPTAAEAQRKIPSPVPYPVERMALGLGQTLGQSTQVPSAISDINRSADPVGFYAKAAQETAGEGAGQALTALAMEGIGRINLRTRIGDRPKGLYESALKPSTTMKPTQVQRLVNVGLEEGIPVSPAGAEKLADLVENLNDHIASTIGSGKGKAINKYSVTSRLGDTAKKFATQVNPEADLAAISESGNEFLRTQPGMIPAKEAQALKQGTYIQLKGKAYGELKSAAIESQKALARGIKEELNQVFPELAGLNARESGLLGLEPVLARAVQRTSNHQLIGLGTPLVSGVAKSITGSNKLALATGAVKAIIDSPSVKSRLAIALYRAGKAKGVTLSASAARVAAYSAALGQASASANSETPDDPASQ